MFQPPQAFECCPHVSHPVRTNQARILSHAANVSNLKQESIVEDVLPRVIGTPELKGGLLNAQAERRSAKVSPIILATYDGELSARTLV